MIESFRHRGLKRLYERGEAARVPADMLHRIEDILAALDVAKIVSDLDRPSYRLHPLKGDRSGQWAITVRANWRITFRFHEGDVFDVDLVGYH
jgi:proteic killer suppression protein